MSLKRPLSRDATSSSAKRPAAPWFNALEASLKDATLHIFQDDQMIIIADKFPKARHHYLALPRAAIDNLQQLNASHLTLLEHLLAQSREFSRTNIENKTKNEIKFGFHEVPSMNRLHLHIISQDFDSSCLKHKKHWNSFTSAFFMDAEGVVEMLRKEGSVVVDKVRGEERLKEPLRCHVCRMALANMPKLKQHIKLHDKDAVGKK